MDELTAQNELFREKTTELLEKNDELSDVVAELGKYYVHMKKASEKTAELSNIFMNQMMIWRRNWKFFQKMKNHR